jgi:hypothetical protein
MTKTPTTTAAQTVRLALAALAAPIAASLTLTAAVFLAILALQHVAAWTTARMFLLVTTQATVLFSLTFGVLWHVQAQARGWTSAYAYMAPLAAIGLVVAFLVLALWFSPRPGAWSRRVPQILWFTAYGGVAAGLTGFFTWALRRPDRDANLSKRAP